MSQLCDLMDCSQPGFCPWDSSGKSWSRLPFTSPADLSHLQQLLPPTSLPRMELLSLALQADSLLSGASLIAQLVKSRPAMQETPWRRDRLPTPAFLGFPGGSAGKESACNVGDLGLIPGLGRSPGEGKGHLLQYSGLDNSIDCRVHGVAESVTTERLSLHVFTV